MKYSENNIFNMCSKSQSLLLINYIMMRYFQYPPYCKGKSVNLKIKLKFEKSALPNASSDTIVIFYIWSISMNDRHYAYLPRSLDCPSPWSSARNASTGLFELVIFFFLGLGCEYVVQWVMDVRNHFISINLYQRK